MRILVYGAGVIGCLYGALLADAGNEVCVYARGKRLESLRAHGLRYKTKQGKRVADATVLASVDPGDCFDFVLLTVREDQLHTALEELQDNASPTIVTMVNSLETCDAWENVCGKGRILPAFPGAGGGFDDDGVLDAGLTPRLIQPTTIGATDGREKQFANLLKAAKIPCQIVGDMHAWQICHLAMVVPIADAYYESDDPEHAGSELALMKKTAWQIKQNLRTIESFGIALSPSKMRLFKLLPSGFVARGLGIAFRSSFGNRFMYQHSLKAPQEMRQLHEQLYGFLTQ